MTKDSSGVANLKPRFLPDRDFAQEWGDLGSLRVRAIRKGLRVPPVAAFGYSQVADWLLSLSESSLAQPDELLEIPMPAHWPESITTLKQLLTGNEDWPVQWSIGDSSIPSVFVRVEGWEAESNWRAFLEAVRASWGHLPLELRKERRGFSVLVSPIIEGEAPQRVNHHPILAAGQWAETVNDGETLWWVQFGVDDVLPAFSRVRHLLVDLDDTLVQAPNRRLRFWLSIHALRRLARSIGWRRAYRALRDGTAEVKRNIDPSEPSAPTNAMRISERVSRSIGMPATQVAELLEDAIAHSFPYVLKLFSPVPGARELLDSTRHFFRHTLATNPVWTEETVRIRLGASGVDTSIFERVTHSKSMVACKPARRYYTDVLKLLGLTDPQEALMIGDSTVLDLPASAVGIPTVLVDSRRSPTDLTLDPIGERAWRGSYAAARWALVRASGGALKPLNPQL